MAYYSFVVVAPRPVGLTKPLLLLDAGVNTFNVVVDDVEELRGFLESEGVQIRQMNRLDAFEENTAEDLPELNHVEPFPLPPES